jgi:hypothetical protein
MTINPVFDENNHCTNYIAVERNISAKKIAEDELQAKSILQQTSEVALVGGWELRMPNRNLYWNDIIEVFLKLNKTLFLP